MDWNGLRKCAESIGGVVRKWAEEISSKVDWDGLRKGAESLGREGRKWAEHVVKAVDWEEAGDTIKKVLPFW